MSLSPDALEFQQKVAKAPISGNIDNPEGGFDALVQVLLNTSYLTDSYIVFTLKMESQPKNIIFGLKMMVKSGLEKFILNSLHAGRWLFLLLNL